MERKNKSWQLTGSIKATISSSLRIPEFDFLGMFGGRVRGRGGREVNTGSKFMPLLPAHLLFLLSKSPLTLYLSLLLRQGVILKYWFVILFLALTIEKVVRMKSSMETGGVFSVSTSIRLEKNKRVSPSITMNVICVFSQGQWPCQTHPGYLWPLPEKSANGIENRNSQTIQPPC